MARKTQKRASGKKVPKKDFKNLLKVIDIVGEESDSSDDFMAPPWVSVVSDTQQSESTESTESISKSKSKSKHVVSDTQQSESTESTESISKGKSKSKSKHVVSNYKLSAQLVGLENSGTKNLCFFNSVFQVLYHIPAFRNYFVTNELNSLSLPKGLPRDVFNSLSSGKASVSPVDIIKRHKNELNLMDYTIGQQFDAHEFLQQLLHVYYPLKKLGESSVFQVDVKGEIYCTCPQGAVGEGTNTPLIKCEKNHILQLPVSSSHFSVSGILQSYQDLYPLDDYPCPSCKSCGHCNQQDFVNSVDGDILILQLKLFDYDRHRKNVIKKTMPRFELESELDFFGKWSLHGLVYHHGVSPRSGHYTCRINVSDRWYTFDDARIFEENFHDMLKEKGHVPYLVFYKRVHEVARNDPGTNQNTVKNFLPEHIEAVKLENVEDLESCIPAPNPKCSNEIEVDIIDVTDDPLTTLLQDIPNIETLEDASRIFECKPTENIPKHKDEDKGSGSGYLRKCSTLQEVEECIRLYEDGTGTQYFKRAANREFGKDISNVRLDKHRIFFNDTQSTEECFRMESDGIPFIVLGSSYRECKHGPDHHTRAKKRRLQVAIKAKESDHCFTQSKKSFQSTVKADCPSRIKIRDVLFFPDSQVSTHDSRRSRNNVSQALKNMNISSVNYIHSYIIEFPNVKSHLGHVVGQVGRSMDQNVAHEIKVKLRSLMKEGVRKIKEMRRHLGIYVQNELFRDQKQPQKTDRRYYPLDRDIRNCMYRESVKMKLAAFDQDNMSLLVEKWKKDLPEDNIYFRGYGKILEKKDVNGNTDKEERKGNESIEEIKMNKVVETFGEEFVKDICTDGNSLKTSIYDLCSIVNNEEGDMSKIDDDDNEDDDPEKGDIKSIIEDDQLETSERLLFVYQSKKQRRLMERYGNHLCLLDATYKTTKYAIPLFFLAVKTNVDYQVVATFAIQDETGKYILEALQMVKDWNPGWDPNITITDNSNQEINALSTLFPQSTLLLCSFHREQAWLRWVSASKNGLIKKGKAWMKDKALELMRGVADAVNMKLFRQSLTALVQSDVWKQNKKFRVWFCRHWLSKYEMWVDAYRVDMLEIVVNTNNGVERINKEFKNYLEDNHDKSLSSMATTLIDEFCPQRYRIYVDKNITPYEKFRPYDDPAETNLPAWCNNRPRKFQKHIVEVYKKAHELSTDFTEKSGDNWLIYNPVSRGTYLVSFGRDEIFPQCECKDWKRHMWPCKHMCRLIMSGLTSWNEWSADYISSPYFNLDSDVLGENVKIPTYNYKRCLLNNNIVDQGKCIEDLIPEECIEDIPLKDSLKSISSRCRDILHQLGELTYVVKDTDALLNLENELKISFQELNKMAPNQEGLNIIEPEIKKKKKKRKYQNGNRIYMQDVPIRAKRKKLSNRVGRGAEFAKKHSQLPIEDSFKEEITVEEHIDEEGPMVFNDNGDRIYRYDRRANYKEGNSVDSVVNKHDHNLEDGMLKNDVVDMSMVSEIPLGKHKHVSTTEDIFKLDVEKVIQKKTRKTNKCVKPIFTPQPDNGDIDFSSHPIDQIAKDLLPTDVNGLISGTAVPLCTTSNGNCLFCSVSLALCGNESLASTLRNVTSLKLSDEPQLFTHHPSFKTASEILNWNEDRVFPFILSMKTQKNYWDATKDRVISIKQEGKRLSRKATHAPLVAVMALAEVIQRPIYSIYPNVNYKLRSLFHQLIYPQKTVCETPIYILWTRCNRVAKGKPFSPNHFVPIIQLNSELLGKDKLIKPLPEIREVIKMDSSSDESVQDEHFDSKTNTSIQNLSNDEIVSCVNDMYPELLKIWSGETNCVRHNCFKKGGNDKLKLSMVEWGTFTQEQLEVITRTLMELFCSDKMDYFDYVIKVLLPETLKMLVVKITSVSLEEADKLLAGR